MLLSFINLPTRIGEFGQMAVLLAFLAAVLASLGYFMSTKQVAGSDEELSWKRFARYTFISHGFFVFAVVGILFYLIYNHRYDYYYAYDHSSNHLPWYYMLSCFWEGQEGSFLLWIFWHVLIGFVLIKVNKKWEAPMMAVFASVQAFLASMLLGVVVPYWEQKIGSSPFLLFREVAPNIPAVLMNPDFVPADGQGLNLLLQNYWMVIHPPTLFLGFALTLVPYSYAIAGLWKKEYKEWVRPALPWALLCAAILGTGILMGGYWAYETLNFGGYWNWDPVENAVYVPWLILIAAIHTMISYRSSDSALTWAIVLVQLSFLLILYSTFLTRSGILGDASVHSFTDLGLSGQLLIYLLAFVALSAYITTSSLKNIKSDIDDVSVYSRELWIFIGALTLCIAGGQIIFTTSIPVFNKIIGGISWMITEWFNGGSIQSRMAPPADLIDHYSDWQIWLSVIIALLSGVGQFFWWKKMDKQTLWDALSIPLIITLLLGIITISIARFVYDIEMKISYLLLYTSALFSLVSNATILLKVWKNSPKISGGAIAHIGVALMLMGVLFSAGYSRVITANNTGRDIFSTNADGANKENSLLNRHIPTQVGEFLYIYKGPRVEADGFPGFVNLEKIIPLGDQYTAISSEDIYYKGEKYFSKGDTVHTDLQNIFYEVSYIRTKVVNQGKPDAHIVHLDTFTIFPRLQANQQMGGNVASPDIKRYASRDIYSHLSAIPDHEDEREWQPVKKVALHMKDTVEVNGYFLTFDTVSMVDNIRGKKLNADQVFFGLHFSTLGKDKGSNLVCGVLSDKRDTENNSTAVSAHNSDIGVRVTPVRLDDANHSIEFEFEAAEPDFIIIKAIEKPLINLLWIGTLMLVAGLGIAVYRRFDEFIKMRDKETN